MYKPVRSIQGKEVCRHQRGKRHLSKEGALAYKTTETVDTAKYLNDKNFTFISSSGG